jgi:hypothetical protein
LLQKLLPSVCRSLPILAARSINLEMTLMRILSNPLSWNAVLLFGGLVYWAYSNASTRDTAPWRKIQIEAAKAS